MRPSKYGGGGAKSPLAFLLCLGIAPSLEAANFAYGLGYAVTHSDNVARVSSGERRETIHSYLIGFSYLDRTSSFDAAVSGQAEYRDYRKDIFEDETISSLRALLYWTISPQRFIWTVEDAYEQRRINVAVADTPDNRANVNVFSTGPDVYFRFNPVHMLALGARAGHVYTGRANVDSDRLSGTARWQYQATSISSYSVNYEIIDVKFEDSTANNSYVNHDVFLRADYRPSRSQYMIDVGASRIDPDRGEDLDKSLLRLSWIRQLTTESSLGLSATREFSDTGADILAVATAPIPSPAPTSGDVRSDVFYAKRANMFYNRRSARFGTNLSLFAQDLDYDGTAQDREEHGGNLKLDIFLSGTTTLTLISDYNRAEYRNFIRRDTDRNNSIRLSYRMTRSVSLALEGRRADRKSTISTEEYVDNRAYLSLLYSSNPMFNPVTAR